MSLSILFANFENQYGYWYFQKLLIDTVCYAYGLLGGKWWDYLGGKVICVALTASPSKLLARRIIGRAEPPKKRWGKSKMGKHHLIKLPLHGPRAGGKLQWFAAANVSSSIGTPDPGFPIFLPSKSWQLSLHWSNVKKLLVFPAQPPYSKVSHTSCTGSQ